MEILYIVMPAYNEEANIENTVKEWYSVIETIGNGSKLVIVDDGSKDSTYEKMRNLQKSYPDFIALTKPNSGHGATCLYAYQYAIEQNVDYIFQTDSDGQTNPAEFYAFWDKRNDYDFVIGSRIGRKDGFSRVFVTKVLKLVVKFIFGVWVEDANTPFRLMKINALKPILVSIPNDFFLSNVAISALAVLEKVKIKWIPISFKPRQGGINSINLKRIFRIGIKAIRDLNEIKKNMVKS